MTLNDNERTIITFLTKWARNGFIETSHGCLQALIYGNKRNVTDALRSLGEKGCIGKKVRKTGEGLIRITVPPEAPRPPLHPHISFAKPMSWLPNRIPDRISRREKVFGKTHGKCFYCGSKDADTIDHMTPKSRGGGGEIENLIGACRKCNEEKGNATKDEYFDILKYRF